MKSNAVSHITHRLSQRAIYHAALLALLALVSGCAAPTTNLWAQMVQIQQATGAFKTTQAAEAAGYAQFMDCTDEPGHGAMGIHFVNGDLVGDTILDPSYPEAILFEPAEEDARLAAVEYIVFAEAWHAEHTAPPMLMGQEFVYVGSPNRYDLPPFYALHAWVWKNNPNGLFAEWNPDVVCPDHSISTHSSHAIR